MSSGDHGTDNRDTLYAYQSVARIMGSAIPHERQLHTRFAWMLVGITGTGHARIGDQTFSLTSGGALLGRPGSFALRLEQGNGPGSVWFIEFAPIVLSDTLEWDAGSLPIRHSALCRRSSHAGELALLAERLYSLMTIHPEPKQRKLTAHSLIQHMLLWWHAEDRDEHDGQRTTDEAVLAALHEMEGHLADSFTREQLAAKAGIASAYFSVRFKKLSGSRPSDYLEKLRVHRASELLLQDGEPRPDLGEIARRTGFRDAWYMSKRFRKVQGVSPSHYRSGFIPERIASLEYSYTHHLLALGIVPCAARLCSRNREVIDPAVREAIRELPVLTSIEGEKRILERSRPQVILTSGSESVQNRYRSIAPVLYIPWLTLSWREQLRAMGRLFGRAAEAEARIDELERQAELVRVEAYALVPRELTISIFKIENKRCYIYGNRDCGYIFYDALGYSPHPAIRERIRLDSQFHSLEIPMRELIHYAADLNIVILDADAGEQGDWLRLNDEWRQLETAGRMPLLYLDYRDWLHYDPIHMAAQLQKVQSVFEKITDRS